MKTNEFEALLASGEILETEGALPKVIRLPEDRILKLFRRKRLLSSQIWMTYAARFAKNAVQLRRRSIPTVQVESIYDIRGIQRQGVLYRMLPGDTLRDWLNGNETKVCIEKCRELGVFIAQLHRHGVLFRSIHFKNILVQPDGSLGLIDIADLKFNYCGALSTRQRIRNLHHMDRHNADRKYLAGQAGNAFLEAYLTAAKVSEQASRRITASFEAIFAKHRKLTDV